MQLSPRQTVVFRDVLAALHLRDEADGLLPAVDRGPPKGLLDATAAAARDGLPLPDLHQLPPNLAFAAQACQLLASHPLTVEQVDGWLDANLAAALGGAPLDPSFDFDGCRSFEDVRNRVLVGLDELSNEELDAFDSAVRDVLTGATSAGS